MKNVEYLTKEEILSKIIYLSKNVHNAEVRGNAKYTVNRKKRIEILKSYLE